MAVRKLNGRYTVEFELKGHRIFRRLPAGATKGQAGELENRLRRELIDQAILGHSPIVSLSWAVQQWFNSAVVGTKSEVATKSKVKLVRELIADETLTKAGITAVAEKIGNLPLAVATINRRLSVLKATAKWAWKKMHWTPENLSPYVILLDKKREVVRARRVTEAVARKIMRKAPNAEAEAFIAFGLYGLMRQGEVMALEKSAIGREGVTLDDSKNGAPRVVPIVPQLRPHLKAVPFKRHARTLYGWFEDARDAAKVRDLVYHDLRRSGATILLNAGVPLEVVAHILGNSMEVARKVYARVLNQTAKKAMLMGFPIKNPIRRKRGSTGNHAIKP